MKKIVSLVGLLTLILVSCTKPLPVPRTIDNPMIEANNTGSLDVTSVTVTDSTTVLNFHVEYQPKYWIRISSKSQIEADGQRYDLIGSEGITPDSLLWMPESGQADFTLIFPAVPAQTRSIDFFEGPDESEWHIWGIDLTGSPTEPTWLSEVPAKVRQMPDLNSELPAAVLDTATTRINVKMLGFRPGMSRKLTFYTNGLGTEQEEHSVTLDSTGCATIDLWLAGTTGIHFVNERRGMGIGSVYTDPGQETNIWLLPPNDSPRKQTTELPEYFTDSRYAARGWGRVLKADYENMYNELMALIEPDYRMTPEQYADAIVNYYKAFTDSLAAHPEMAPLTREMLLMSARSNVVQYAGYPQGNMLMAAYRKFGWGSPVAMDSLGFYSPLPVEEYRKIADLFDFANPALMPYLYNQGLYGTAMDFKEYGFENPLIAECVKFPKYYREATVGELTEAQMDTLCSWSTPYFAQVADYYQQKAKRMLESDAASLIQTTPDVAPDKVFDAIIEPHKGKVVIVDIWNTWCGPCRSAIAENEPEKADALSDPDIVFVYIANETSPMPKYLEMIPDIKGLHYRVPEDVWRPICERFGVDGIPFYVLVGRDGKPEARPDLRNHSKYKEAILTALDGK